MLNQHIIFDFDGTLVDSYHCLVKKFILLADEFNFRKLNEHEIYGLRDLNSRELIKFLNIPMHKIPKLIRRVRFYLHEEIRNLAPIPHLPEVLIKLHDSGRTLGILTSNSKENVSTWLKLHKLHHLFKFVRIEPNYFSKKALLKKIIITYKIDKSHAFYIGDETRDIEAAKHNGIRAVAVTWGYNSEKILLQAEPHHIAKKPEDLLIYFGL